MNAHEVRAGQQFEECTDVAGDSQVEVQKGRRFGLEAASTVVNAPSAQAEMAQRCRQPRAALTNLNTKGERARWSRHPTGKTM